MGALDKLNNYCSIPTIQENETSDFFNLNTESGKFLYKVHNKGFKMYNYVYECNTNDIDNIQFGEKIKEDRWNSLSEDKKLCFTKKTESTELYRLITTNGNQCINAIAGSGKTTSLIFKILYDVVSGNITHTITLPTGATVTVVDSVLVCTFLKTGAEELKTALIKWQRELGLGSIAEQIKFSTLDAEFKHCLNEVGVKTDIADNGFLDGLLKKAVDSVGIKRLNGDDLLKEDYQIIGGIVKYFRGRLDIKRATQPSMKDYNIKAFQLQSIVKQYDTLRKANNVVDFDEVQELLYKFLYTTPNSKLQDFVANRYKYIYIDEFQDTSQLQYALLKFYARGHLWCNVANDPTITDDFTGYDKQLFNGVETRGKIVAIGDPSQCIYSFKGSDSKILVENFDRDFRPTITHLSCNYRCPANILNPIVPSIHINKDSANQAIFAANEGGEFHIYEFPTIKGMAEKLIADITEDMEKGRQIGVLCRTNYDGVIPAIMLELDHKYDYGIANTQMTLDSPLPRKLGQMYCLFTDNFTPMVKECLNLIAPWYSKSGINKLMDVLKTNQLKLWTIPLEDIKYSIPNLYDYMKAIHDDYCDDNGIIATKKMEALRFTYYYLLMNVYKTDNAYNASAKAYLETLIYIMDNVKLHNIYEYRDYLGEIGEKLQNRIGRKSAPIQVATVHEFKGKERESIIVWNDSETIFPSKKCNLEDEEQVAEERRVHYIACTRAKEKCCIYTKRGSVGLFVREMAGKIESPVRISTTLSKDTSNLAN